MKPDHTQVYPNDRSSFLFLLNTSWHEWSLRLFMAVTLLHWAEHLTQAYQIWVMGWSRPEALGLIGYYYPWLVHSEWLHYGYALVMLLFFFLLYRGFTGRSLVWWRIALAIQFWHHIEHALLLAQTLTGHHLAGSGAPTSLIQLIVPRVELHLFYNTIVFVPMIVAMLLHMLPTENEKSSMNCSCSIR
ncbi:hypothetical protein [Paenibacillus tarimensis]|uniref:hypothetical protein n=1 Tax=Paenibacillus tarimensis TaxID=416012 RepID=UPI001F36EC2B|nr:hypothetical protein [Paenibacillus tarimensis]MCF2945540.1 hypothetical protein [Paenibacillus tarimensis]